MILGQIKARESGHSTDDGEVNCAHLPNSRRLNIKSHNGPHLPLRRPALLTPLKGSSNAQKPTGTACVHRQILLSAKTQKQNSPD
jgi:hypothetical protein